MKRPKLVHLVTSPQTARAFLRGQLAFLREQGFDVTLVSAPGPDLDYVGQTEGVATIAVPMRREPSPLHDLASLKRLTNVFRTLRPEIVHYGTPKASFLGGLAAKLARVPIRVMTLHGMRADGLGGLPRRVVLAMERLSCGAAQRVFCVGESLRTRALELKLAAPHKLKVLANGTANGIDSAYFSRSPDVLSAARALQERLKIPSGCPVIGFVGRLVQDKGVAELIAAFQQLRPEFPGIKLLLVGPFEDYDGLSVELRDAIGQDEEVLQLGFLDDPRPAYALMTALALPSYREGFPYVPMEAAAMGVPVIATQVTGCVDAVVPGVTGALTPPRDSRALADALSDYLRSPELVERHGAAGRDRVLRDFPPRVVWEALSQEYGELLDAAPSPNKPQSVSAANPGLGLALQEIRAE
jgi:glycosyltransferase involved in cell wall biosynthesis